MEPSLTDAAPTKEKAKQDVIGVVQILQERISKWETQYEMELDSNRKITKDSMEEVERLTSEVERLQKDLEDRESELSIAREHERYNLDALEELQKTLERDLADADLQRSRMIDLLQESQDLVRSHEKEIGILRSRVLDLQKQLEEVDIAYGGSLEQIRVMDESNSKLKGEIKECQDKVSRLENELSAMSRKHEEEIKERERESSERLKIGEEKLNQANEELAKLENIRSEEVSALKSSLQELTTEAESREIRVRSLDTERSALIKEKEEERKELAKLREELSEKKESARTTEEAMRNTVNALQANEVLLTDKITQLQSLIDIERKKLMEVTAEAERNARIASDEELRGEALKESLSRSVAQFEQLERNHATLKVSCLDLEVALSAEKERYSSLQFILQRKESELEEERESSRQNERLSYELTEEIKRWKTQCATLEAECSELKERLNTAREEEKEDRTIPFDNAFFDEPSGIDVGAPYEAGEDVAVNAASPSTPSSTKKIRIVRRLSSPSRSPRGHAVCGWYRYCLTPLGNDEDRGSRRELGGIRATPESAGHTPLRVRAYRFTDAVTNSPYKLSKPCSTLLPRSAGTPSKTSKKRSHSGEGEEEHAPKKLKF